MVFLVEFCVGFSLKSCGSLKMLNANSENGREFLGNYSDSSKLM